MHKHAILPVMYLYQYFVFPLLDQENKNMRLTVTVLSYFKKYVQREIAQGSGVSIYKPIQGWRHVRKRQWIFDEDRPWTDAAKDANKPGKRLTELIEPIPESEWRIFLGDRVSTTVEILSNILTTLVEEISMF